MNDVFETNKKCRFSNHLLDKNAYAFECTLFRFICLTVKALRRIMLRGFLVSVVDNVYSIKQAGWSY